MRAAAAFARFWYAFVVGDDWRVALGLAAALGLSALLEQAGVTAWWLLPLAVVVLLALSVRRAIREAE
jgi:hypothetical protein